jgi:CubicO group peptidase (beta-lactamase class C family)
MYFRRWVVIAAATLLAACASTTAQGPLPPPDQNGSYLFWNPQEQLVGYRNIERIFPTNLIRRGREVAPLPRGPRLDVRYDYADEVWDTARFMEASNAGGVLVIHNGRVVLEEYALGYGPGQRWISFSVAKSMSSTLAGAALKDGYIKSLDDPVTDYLPALRGSAYEGVNVRQLLTMTSGVAWNEDYADPNSDVGRIRTEKSVNGSDPIVTFMSRLPREAEPGTKFVYKTGETHLVGALVRAATGKILADYLTEKVWTPYGMEEDAVWMLDDAGHEYAGCCVSATLRDFGRFGLFFLRGAEVDGVSIVPDTWIAEATTSAPAALRENGSGYGYQWWTRPGGVYQALGIFGQLIHIDPSQDLIIVVQSAWPTSGDGASSRARAAYVRAVEAAVRAQGT